MKGPPACGPFTLEASVAARKLNAAPQDGAAATEVAGAEGPVAAELDAEGGAAT